MSKDNWIKVEDRLPGTQDYYFVKTARNRKEVYHWKNEEVSANIWENEVSEWLEEDVEICPECKQPDGKHRKRCSEYYRYMMDNDSDLGAQP